MNDRNGHGGDTYGLGPLTDFSISLNPMGMPPGVRRAAIEALLAPEAYPDPQCRDLRSALARFEHASEEHILCGNGAAELIYAFAMAVRPRSAVIIEPTFSEYEAALARSGTQVIHHVLPEEEDFALDVARLPITKDTDAVFLCNPNNPTGTIADAGQLAELVDRCAWAGAVLAVDECFGDLADEETFVSLSELTDTHANLFLFKAFTKSFALAGVRLGYALCGNGALLSAVRSQIQPWNVSGAAQAAGVAACREKEFLSQSRKYIHKERAYLRDGLRAFGVEVFESGVNFLLLRCERPLDELLNKRDILIRSCSNFHGLNEHYFRVGVRKHEDNELLLRAVKESLYG